MKSSNGPMETNAEPIELSPEVLKMLASSDASMHSSESLVTRPEPSLRRRILTRDSVVTDWGTIIAGAAGMGQEIVEKTEQLVVESGVPDITMTRQNAAAGFWQSLTGGQRRFLVLYSTKNSRLKQFQMYLNTRDYGTSLQVFWCVICKPSMWSQLMRFVLFVPAINLVVLPWMLITGKKNPIASLDLFDELDLKACISITHRCMLDAVDTIGKDRGVDTSKINREIKGFVGIS